MAMPYFPTPYTSAYPAPFPTPMMANQFNQNQQQSQTGLIVAWVQGEQAMKSYSLGPNQKAFLFNTEENNFGIKSTDANGMPSPLEMFAYHRINGEPKQTPQATESIPAIDTSSFVTRKEFEERIAEFIAEFENKERSQNNNQNRGGDNRHGK